MQNNCYGYDICKLTIFVCVTFIFIVISSSTTALATEGIGQNLSQAKPLDDKGAALLYSGKYNESITYIDKALGIDHNDTRALDLKGSALFYSGKYNDSISYYDKALAINPNDVGALTGKGFVLAKLGKYNDSISYYDKALTKNPNFVPAIKQKKFAVAAAAHNTKSKMNTSRASTVPEFGSLTQMIFAASIIGIIVVGVKFTNKRTL